MTYRNAQRSAAALLAWLLAMGAATAQTVNGCNEAAAEDHTADVTPVLVKFGTIDGVLKYKPDCIKVLSTSTIQFSPAGATNFGSHPLVAGIVSGGGKTPDPTSPIPNQSSGTSQTAFAIATPGVYGYYCNFHAISANMFGAIVVVSDTLFADGFEAAN